MMTKFVIVDYDKMGETLNVKTEYLKTNIPNPSIEIIDQYNLPFSDKLNQEFKNEVKDFFIKHVHMFILLKNKLMSKLIIMKMEIQLDLKVQVC